MTKISNKDVYIVDTDVSDLDSIIGTDGNSTIKRTKNFSLGSLKDYFKSGLSPLTGGTLRFTEISYTGGLYASVHALVNALDPFFTIDQYHVVVVNLNGAKSILKLQNVGVGLNKTPVVAGDFISIKDVPATPVIPTLDQVLLAGNTALNKEVILNSAGTISSKLTNQGVSFKNINPSQNIEYLFTLGGIYSYNKDINNITNLTFLGLPVNPGNNVFFSTPLKSAGSYTIAVSSDIPTVESSSLNVSQTGNVITIETPIVSDVPSFIVNSDYTGVVEAGTAAKPFKNLQNALDAYVGDGATNKVPDNIGTVIVVQKDANIFTGSLAYKGLNISIENGATLVSNPSAGTFLIDLDSEATLPANVNYTMSAFGNLESCEVSITIKRGGNIQLQKQGFKNRGNTLNTGSSLGKIIRIFGDFSGIYKTAEASVATPSTQRIFSLNADNQSGFYNDGAEACVFLSNLTTQSFNSQIAYIGLGSTLKHSDCIFQFGTSGTPFNIGTVPFQLNGGTVKDENSSINNPLLLTNLISLKTQASTGSVYKGINSKIGDSCDYIFANIDTGTTTSNQLILDKCSNYSPQIEAFAKNFMSSNLWNIKLTNCNTVTWSVNGAKIALIPSSLNTLGGKLIESLDTYNNRTSAVSAGLPYGAKFINTGGVVSPTTGWFVDIVM